MIAESPEKCDAQELSHAAIRTIISPMNFSTDALLAASPKDAARTLYDAGRDLRGKNLRRGSWLEIAHAPRSQRAQQLPLPRKLIVTARDPGDRRVVGFISELPMVR